LVPRNPEDTQNPLDVQVHICKMAYLPITLTHVLPIHFKPCLDYSCNLMLCKHYVNVCYIM
jgi:hypothetical protein